MDNYASFGDKIQDILLNWGLSDSLSIYLKNAAIVLGIIILCILADWITKKIFLAIVQQFVKKSKTDWDDILYQRKVFHKLSHIAPAIIVFVFAPLALYEFPVWLTIVENLVKVYIVLLFLMVINAFLNGVYDIYSKYEVSKSKPIKGYIQVVKIIIYLFGAILMISFLIGRSPVYLLTGLGAISAVLLLVFKDPILGFVGSVQLSANKMVSPGDWITMSKYGADGTVIDISLTSVKVQNFDKTIVTIPTYSMVSDSFQNWKGMEESNGRRIKRAINLDMNSIRICDEAMLKRFGNNKILTKYILKKEEEIKKYNEDKSISEKEVNARRQTNIGIFRAYMEAYLHEHPQINQDMTFLIRQLDPNANGLPIEVYVFCKTKAWAEYESIQADIFDHLLAVIPEFELKVFQNPSGADFGKITR